MQPDSLLSIEETCQRLGKISRATVYKLLDTGELRSMMIRGRRFVPQSEVDAFIERAMTEQ